MRAPLAAIAFAFCALAVASCFAPVVERQCERDVDCGSGWKCIAASCVPGNATGGGGGSSAAGGGTGVGGGLAVGGGSGGGSNTLCNRGNCKGCCAGNTCIELDDQSQTNCGFDGNACLSCNVNALCKAGQCFGGVCDSTNCPQGCCLSNVCVNPNLQNEFACGIGGGLCQGCGMGRCESGACIAPTCDKTNCPNGCCAGTTCLPITSQSPMACGNFGQSCAPCANNSTCNQGTCTATTTCNASNCAGCCLGNSCVPTNVQNSATCGRGGATCGSCGPGQVCTGGACVSSGCGPMSCMGCCLNGSCAGGNDPFACGRGGQTCTSCAPGSQCLMGACQACGPNTCAGCCLGGFCQTGNLDQACGVGGAACTSCPAGNSCQSQRCAPIMSVGVGSPCNSNNDCSPLGMGATCKRVTSTGNATYQGGYCTLRCGTGVTCPNGSSCANLGGQGENDNICLRGCSGGNPCRPQGYTCYAFPQGNFNGCWIFPTPTVDGGFTVDAGRPDAGQGNLPTGSACTNDVQCQPPSSAFCLPQTLSMLNTGYTGGYCSRNCSAANPCPGGAVCITETFGTVTNTSCKQLCTNPGMGQGVCRTGYICTASSTGLVGWCGPRCNNQSFPCPGGGSCNFATGYCQ